MSALARFEMNVNFEMGTAGNISSYCILSAQAISLCESVRLRIACVSERDYIAQTTWQYEKSWNSGCLELFYSRCGTDLQPQDLAWNLLADHHAWPLDWYGRTVGLDLPSGFGIHGLQLCPKTYLPKSSNTLNCFDGLLIHGVIPFCPPCIHPATVSVDRGIE